MNTHKHDSSVVLLIIVFFSHLVIGRVSRKDYGESCSKTEKCKSQSWLTCDSSTETCLCAKPEEMVYSSYQQKCLAMIGERCKFGFDEDDSEPQGHWYEKMDCIPNAECGSSGVCQCLPEFYEEPNGTSCHPVKIRGMSCVNDFECNQDHLLACINSSCQCDPNKSIYSSVTYNPFSGGRGWCQSKVGSACISSMDDYCIPDAECGSSGVCQCLPEFYEDTNGTSCHPVKFRGMSCVNDFECDQDHVLVCINSSCQCDPTKSIYSADTPNPFSGGFGRCVGKVGSTCTSRRDDYCSPDTHCEYDGTTDYMTCKCRYPLEPTSNGQCGVSYGVSCSNERQNCIDSLVCLSFSQNGSYSRSSCSCPDASYQKFDSSTHTCRSIVGSPCNPKQNSPCTPMAKCIENQNSGMFLCECDDGHVETSRGTCQKAHGQTCSFGQGKDEICDEKAGLVCLKGSCGCTDASNVYENGRRQCSRPVGVTCTKTSQCVANAFCDKFQGEGLSGRCKCLKNYHHVSKNRECVLDADPTEDFFEGNSTVIKVP
jgi:hypothetical protein